MRGREWPVGLLFLAGLAGVPVVTTMAAIAVNVATSDESAAWLAPVRTHPLWWVTGSTLLAWAAAWVAWWAQRVRDRRLGELVPVAQRPEAWVVKRPDEINLVVSALTRRSPGTVGITTAVQGEGGFGKTTVAKLVGSDRRVLRRFRGRVYWVTLGRDVRSRVTIAAKVNDLIIRLDPDRVVSFTDPEQAGEYLAALLADRRCLLILDDVWYPEQERAFSVAGRSARLITTRVSSLVAGQCVPVKVDQLTEEQTLRLLTADLPHSRLSPGVVAELVAETGRWPLLVRLVNKVLVDHAAATGPGLDRAARVLLAHFRDRGVVQIDTVTGAALAGLDINDPGQRARAVSATIEASAGLLTLSDRARFRELAVFVEDETIPVELIIRLWQRSGGLDPLAAPSLLTRLYDLALIAWGPGGTITVHDVVRDYLRAELGETALTNVHQLLINAAVQGLPNAEPINPTVASNSVATVAWWKLPETARYLSDHLIEHLRDANHRSEAETVAADLRWIVARLDHAGPLAPLTDLTVIPTPLTSRLRRVLGQNVHLLGPIQPAHSRTDILYSRVAHDPYWASQADALSGRRTQPRLTNHRPLPDLPHPALHLTLAGHPDHVNAVAISPDGQWLATASGRKTMLWDWATGLCTATLTDHTRGVNGVAISPDGAWLATTAQDAKVRIWDRATGACTATLTGHVAVVWCVAISPDGTWLATTSLDTTVRVWDRATGTCTAILTGHTKSVTGVAISPDGTWLATSAQDATVRIWDRATGTCTTILTGHTDMVLKVAISPDGTWLATASGDETARLWDRSTGTCTATLTGHTMSVWGVAISPDGTWLATTSQDATVRVWDRATGTCTATLTGHAEPVNDVAISPDGTLLATTSNKTLRIWSLAGLTNGQLSDRSEWVENLAISADGKWLATGFKDKTVKVWDWTTGTCTATLTGHTGPVNDVAISPDGKWLATTAFGDKAVRIWDRATGTCITTLTGHTMPPTGVAISPDGTWLATTSIFDKTVWIWDQATGTGTTLLTGHNNQISKVAISPDSTWLATVSSNHSVQLWDRDTGTCTAVLTHVDDVSAMAISPDGTWLATTSNDARVRVWDRATGTCTTVVTDSRNSSLTGVAISPDGIWLATTAFVDKTVRIWDRSTGTCAATLTDHTSTVTDATFSPDGKWLATTSNDATIRVWDRATWGCVAVMAIEGHCSSCHWSPDAQRIAAAGRSGLYLFDFHPD